ncbi:MAG: putative phosphoserine phosphatase/1-acylglycerol-3-phosphate O-acyltransferase [Candidatus Aldehydirespiratoraceae bacterium]|jgi:putative phosphoserine phosphatase/1-acylglycerol-3-phosphate O-acyltransferase
MARPTAAIFDLDRTLITSSSAMVFQRHLAAAGLGSIPDIPLADAFMKFYEQFGESWVMMQPAKLGSRTAKGWSVATVHEAATAAAAEIADELVLPFARNEIDDHRKAGRLLVLATTSPEPWVSPLAEALGFDAVVATKWVSAGGEYTGETDGAFVWGRKKAEAVEAWAVANSVVLDGSFAYSDSYFDASLLELVGNPVAINPDIRLQALAAIKGWKVRHFDALEGVIKVAGREFQEWSRPFVREELQPFARFEFSGIENIPAKGAAILVFNHRSYFDPSAMALVAAKAKRNVRSLGKKEVFDVPIIGRLMRGIGGVRVDRGTGSDEPLEAAAEALRGGEVLMLAPEGTIPRGPAFFDPELKGRWGAAKLAAMTGAPVIPVGIWGTEKVWPRSARMPKMPIGARPLITVTVGAPIELGREDPDADTEAIMAGIVAILPDEAREHHVPTEEELALTYPPGYSGDPEAEADRRPGTDTSTS